jgi:hypothetical protein
VQLSVSVFMNDGDERGGNQCEGSVTAKASIEEDGSGPRSGSKKAFPDPSAVERIRTAKAPRGQKEKQKQKHEVVINPVAIPVADYRSSLELEMGAVSSKITMFRHSATALNENTGRFEVLKNAEESYENKLTMLDGKGVVLLNEGDLEKTDGMGVENAVDMHREKEKELNVDYEDEKNVEKEEVEEVDGVEKDEIEDGNNNIEIEVQGTRKDADLSGTIQDQQGLSAVTIAAAILLPTCPSQENPEPIPESARQGNSKRKSNSDSSTERMSEHSDSNTDAFADTDIEEGSPLGGSISDMDDDQDAGSFADNYVLHYTENATLRCVMTVTDGSCSSGQEKDADYAAAEYEYDEYHDNAGSRDDDGDDVDGGDDGDGCGDDDEDDKGVESLTSSTSPSLSVPRERVL